MENPKFQLTKSSANYQYYFVLKAKNGEIVLKGSEGYTTKQNCLNAIASVKVNAPFDSRYERRDSYANYTFNLKAGNGLILGNSENYTTSLSRETGIEAVKRDAPKAPLDDLT